MKATRPTVPGLAFGLAGHGGAGDRSVAIMVLTYRAAWGYWEVKLFLNISVPTYGWGAVSSVPLLVAARGIITTCH